MIFTETPLKGAYIIDIEPHKDNRGWFSRTFCKEEFEKHGLCTEFVQHNSSYNALKGTIRGLHYQIPPDEEIKIVSCVKGCIFDVIVDVRKDSSTYMQWFSVELSESNGRMLYIPKDFAHGFQTLCDETMVLYQMSEYYKKGSESGIRWNDATLNIDWPEKENVIMSEKDSQLQLLNNK